MPSSARMRTTTVALIGTFALWVDVRYRNRGMRPSNDQANTRRMKPLVTNTGMSAAKSAMFPSATINAMIGLPEAMLANTTWNRHWEDNPRQWFSPPLGRRIGR